MKQRSHHPLGLTAACLPLMLLTTACQTTDRAFLTPEGRHIKDVAPVAYRIAVAPLSKDEDLDLATANDSDLRFTFTLAQLQQQLVKNLREVRAATEVFAVGDDAIKEARARRADLLLRPRLTSVRIAHEGRSDTYLLSVFLWLSTWIGGMFVDDSSYDARLQIEWDLVNPYDNRSIDSMVASSELASLSYWQRNSAFSPTLLQTAVLPPVWTADNAEITSRTLSELACARVAARLAGYLKFGFNNEARDVLGDFRPEFPRNGSAVGATTRLRGKVVAREPITELSVFLNDKLIKTLDGKQLPAPTEQRRGSLCQLQVLERLQLAPGRNLVAIEFSVSGAYTSRTFALHSIHNNGSVKRGRGITQ